MKSLANRDIATRNHQPMILGVVYFCYAICAALIFQKVLLPLVPSMHAVGGLVSEDALYFDSVAWEMAERIQQDGWHNWHLFPAIGASGNVALLGALYAVFGHDPTLIIPVNAAIHALGGVLIFLLARELASKQIVGTYTGVIAASLFIVYPSALNWFGQLHKDGYAIAGILLILLSWVKALRQSGQHHGWLGLLLANAAGIGLVAVVRPYNMKLLLLAEGVICLILLAGIVSKRMPSAIRMLAFFACSAIVTAGSSKLIGDYAASTAADSATLARMGESYANWQGDGTWQWRDSALLPDSLERQVELAARTRAGLIASGIAVNAQSMIDSEVRPQSTAEVIAYLPRALQVAMFAPFPTTWFTQIKPTRMVAVAETMINYLCFPGILLLLLYNRRPEVILSAVFAAFFLVVNGFTLANVGTLYRVRYAYEFIMLLLGVLGWFTWLGKAGYLGMLQNLLKPPAQAAVAKTGGSETDGSRRRETLSSGLLVMGLTLLCFLGFFVRDIMMTHTFGLGGNLDNFFIALLVPMFIVTVLCMPLGSVFVPLYLELKEREIPQAVRKWVGSISSWATFGLLLISVVIYLAGPTLLPLLYKNDATPDMGQLTFLLGWALLILVFSGMVILGNSVLNANGRPVMSSAAQLVVPVVAILALLLFGERYGVQVVMFGMVMGQVLNLLIVQYLVRQHDVSLLQTRDLHKPVELNSFWSQYSPMAATAFFVSVSALVSSFLAMSLPEGAVSAFNLGNKVVLFVTGLVGTAITAVVLPYFSSLVSKNHLVAARRELSLFLLFSTFISVPISAFLFVWSQPIVSLLFEGRNFDSASTEMVARVMQYAVVQLPFFVCNSLLLKFATATRHVIAIFAVALIGLPVNIGTSLLLMKHMGVAGIALGSTFSMVVSTILLVLILVRYWHITWTDAIVMLINWMLFVTLLVGVHFASVPSIFVTVLAYGVLLVGYFYSLSDEKPMEFKVVS